MLYKMLPWKSMQVLFSIIHHAKGATLGSGMKIQNHKIDVADAAV